jgi:hypothetical protein
LGPAWVFNCDETPEGKKDGIFRDRLDDDPSEDCESDGVRDESNLVLLEGGATVSDAAAPTAVSGIRCGIPPF